MIEPSEEMIRAARKATKGRCNPLECDECTEEALAAALAIVERDRSDAVGLTRGANAARRIAARYGEKGEDRTRADWRMWTAMSAGARAVAVRLIELADAEAAP